MLEGYSLGICQYDLPAFILVIAMFAVILVHNYRFKKKREEYQKAAEKNNQP